MRKPIVPLIPLLGLVAVLVTVQARADEFAWATRMGGADHDEGYGIAMDASGNTYVSGEFSGTASFGPYNLTSAGLSDVFVAKLNSSGAVQWVTRMGGTDFDQGYGIAVDAGSNSYVTGYFQGTANFGAHNLTSAGSNDVFVTKLDSTGAVQWATRMGSPGIVFAENGDQGVGIAVDTVGNTYVTGVFGGTADFGAYNLTSVGSNDIFVAKLNGTGVLQWATRMGGPSVVWTEDGDHGNGIAVDMNGNSYVTGTFFGTADFGPYNLASVGLHDIFVTELNSSGVVQWATRMGGTDYDQGSDSDHGYGITVDGARNTYVSGWFHGTADFGGYNLASAGRDDVFVAKLNGTGVVQWATRMGATEDDRGYGIAQDSSGNTYVTGWFQGTADFGAFNLTSLGAYDVFVEKLDSSGAVQWSKRMGGGSADIGYAIVADIGGSVYLAGKFAGTAGFGAYNLTSSTNYYDIFVTKFSQCDTFVATSAYGRLLFSPLCTRDASLLPGGPGNPYVFSSKALTLYRGLNDRFYVSRDGTAFTNLAVDDAVHVNGQDSGLGPYQRQPGIPPYKLNLSIEENLVPLPAKEVTTLIPMGSSMTFFEALDTQRAIYGNTAVYLVQDCGIWLSGNGPTAINYVSYDDQVPATLPVAFDVRYGVLSQLRADRNFSRITCLGRFTDTPGTIGLVDPPAGDGYYFLAKEWGAPPGGGCFSQNYGDSNLATDPRDALNSLAECP